MEGIFFCLEGRTVCKNIYLSINYCSREFPEEASLIERRKGMASKDLECKSREPKDHEEFLHPGASYLRVAAGNYVVRKGNAHSYCRDPRSIDEKKVTQKPSFFKRLYHTFVG